MTCLELESLLDAYARGAVSDTLARELEVHASSCAACTAQLEALPPVNVSEFSPALPPELRTVTLAAVTQRRARRQRVRWIAGAVVAAAAVTAIVALPKFTNNHRAQAGDTVASVTDTAKNDNSPAARLATAQAVTEFHALDAAALELQTALDAAPGDAQLRAFLASVHAQRDELRRRVEAANT